MMIYIALVVDYVIAIVSDDCCWLLSVVSAVLCIRCVVSCSCNKLLTSG